ncbi:DEAD-domain-containing protein [Xylariaceae sp. FL1272]|nr:DEAD-domain-containing protein [Xylariaceae sp. FL1272]
MDRHSPVASDSAEAFGGKGKKRAPRGSRRGRHTNAAPSSSSHSQADTRRGGHPGSNKKSKISHLHEDTGTTTSSVERESDDVKAGSGAPLTIDLPTDTSTFAELGKNGIIHTTLLKTITEDFKFHHMTPVQAATLQPLLADHADVLAQAKTGTGKTIAFLLPAIQHLMHRKPCMPAKSISLLVISPTRELAMQIAQEAEALLQRLSEFKVCIAIGGTNKNTEGRRIRKGCDILIATPGRLLDHLEDEDGEIAEMLQSLNTLVLDEADRLLDMGFIDSLRKIIRYLPDKKTSKRQGMLFSATVPERVREVAHLALSDGYRFINTIPKGEIGTHQRVPQQLVVVPDFSDLAAATLGSIRQEISLEGIDTFKAIVFAPTAGLADFYAEILEKSSGFPQIYALHARMSQSKRTKTTDEYRQAQNGILVATDVVARGMDFPAVTNVFQVGVPSDKESFIHRLGRTGRAGAEGRGTFIITEYDTYFSKWTLKEVSFDEASPDLSAHDDVLKIATELDNHARIYQSWLGFYASRIKPMKWDKPRLVQEANRFALEGLGAPEVPSLAKSTVGKMGLKGVKGLVVVPDPPREKHGQQKGRGN